MMYLDVLLAIAALIGPKSSSNVTALVFRFLADTKKNTRKAEENLPRIITHELEGNISVFEHIL